jgi:predicted dehydrogenase
LNDPEEVGGRLLGEGCHFVDFTCWLAGSLPDRITCSTVKRPGEALAAAGGFTIVMDFPGGSVGTIIYTPEGSPDVGKEYLEVHSGATTLILNDWRVLEANRDGRVSRTRRRKRDKGHSAQLGHLKQVLIGAEEPEDLSPLETMAWTLRALESAGTGRAIS